MSSPFPPSVSALVTESDRRQEPALRGRYDLPQAA